MLAELIFGAFGLFSVPHLTHGSVTRLVQHYLKDFPPKIALGDAEPPTPLDDTLVASGLFSFFDAQSSCGGKLVGLRLTQRGEEVATERGWSVRGSGSAIQIPLGTFSLVSESITYSKQPYLPGIIHFSYWFRGNANVAYLLSLARASEWGSVGMHDGVGVTLDMANRLNAESLPIRWSGTGWVIEKEWPRPGPIC